MSTTDQLQNSFEFSADDLNANRAGKITDWQRRRLAGKESSARYGLALPGVPVAFIVVFRDTPPLFFLVMIGLTVYLAYRAYHHWHSLQVESRMTDGVESVYGWLSKETTSNRNSTTYWLEVNGHRFKVSRWQYDNLTGRLEYRIFYAPLSRTILSIEAEESRGNQPGYFTERLGTL